ncbi:hypothetical protein L9F63_013214, partial [Diploptera punctata]
TSVIEYNRYGNKLRFLFTAYWYTSNLSAEIKHFLEQVFMVAFSSVDESPLPGLIFGVFLLLHPYKYKAWDVVLHH